MRPEIIFMRALDDRTFPIAPEPGACLPPGEEHGCVMTRRGNVDPTSLAAA